MRYWYDCEFIEDGQTIDLVSIGVVADDGREYYAISEDFNPKKASQWVKDNVLSHLPARDANPIYSTIAEFHEAKAWRPRKQIAQDLIAFFDVEKYGKPELWGYYSAYDHVVLCQLYGPMIDLPKGFPFYTRDIKQWCDSLGNPKLPTQDKGEHHALADARWNKQAWEFLRDM